MGGLVFGGGLGIWGDRWCWCFGRFDGMGWRFGRIVLLDSMRVGWGFCGVCFRFYGIGCRFFSWFYSCYFEVGIWDGGIVFCVFFFEFFVVVLVFFCGLVFFC